MLDTTEVCEWLTLLYADVPGLIHISSYDDWNGKTFPNSDIDSVINYVIQLNSQRRQGIYCRVGTLKATPVVGRGGVVDTMALPALWADVDIEGPGHEHVPCVEPYCQPGKPCPAHTVRRPKGGVRTLPLPPDVESARKIIDRSGLPEPSLWIHSGGGLYPKWLIKPAFVIKDDNELRGRAATLSTRWQQAIAASAARLGWHYGSGIGDLARVLRLPGTINRKVAGLEKPCRILDHSGPTYTIEDLENHLAVLLALASRQPQPPKDLGPTAILTGLPSQTIADKTDQPGDEFNRRAAWPEILEPHGAMIHYVGDGNVTYWTRPGKTTDTSATTNALGTDRLHIFSTNWPPFEAGESYHKFAAYALLNHNGDFQAATRAVVEMGYGKLIDFAAKQRQDLDVLVPGWDTIRQSANGKPAKAATKQGNKQGIPKNAVFGMELSDSILAESLAATLNGRHLWCKGLGWLGWNGQRWAECSEETVGEVARDWAINRFLEVAKTGNKDTIDVWRCILALRKQRAALTLVRGIIERKVDEFDAHPDLLNTPTGVVDLRTGKITPHDPGLLLTKITSGSYRPGYTHPDWEQALKALPDDATRIWMQARIGQGATGHRSPDGVNVIMQGSGENGKGVICSDGVVPALGDYAAMASQKLIADTNEHSEEMATLRGQRLVIAEELTEGRALNVGAIKRISDVPLITARHVHQKNMTFTTTHTLFATTNYDTVVNETDHGTWRRLALVVFPFTYRKPHEPLLRPTDRQGDPELKRRIEQNLNGQHDAIVTWIVDGAIRWYAQDAQALQPSPAVAEATDRLRAKADRIYGFWQAHLTADKDACIPAEELLCGFNSWLRSNGHHPWPRELFAPRFAGHAVTTLHGVESRRVSNPKGVSRWAPLLPTPPEQPQRLWVWLGVRFRTAADQHEDDLLERENDILPVLPEPKVTFPIHPTGGKVTLTSGSTGSDSEGVATAGGGVGTQPTTADPDEEADIDDALELLHRELGAVAIQDERDAKPAGTCGICGEALDPKLATKWQAIQRHPKCDELKV